jgi:hypothetical protein
MKTTGSRADNTGRKGKCQRKAELYSATDGREADGLAGGAAASKHYYAHHEWQRRKSTTYGLRWNPLAIVALSP